MFKTASADLIDYSLHNYLAKLRKPVIISTGMSSLVDIKKPYTSIKKIEILKLPYYTVYQIILVLLNQLT